MKRSYIGASLQKPFIYETVPDRLRKLAEDDPEREAYVFYGYEFKRVPVTRKQVYDTAVKLGKTLVNMGLKKGDRVGFCMNNSVEMLHATMAVISAGCIPFFLTTNLKDGSDVIQTLFAMNCSMLIIDARVNDDNWKILESLWSRGSNESKSVPSLKYIVCNGLNVSEGKERTSLVSLINISEDFVCELPILDPEDILVYLITSGSTREPKKVAYTHFSILNWTREIDQRTGVQQSSRFFNDRQFTWAVGFPRTYLVTGVTRIFTDTRLTLSGKHVDRLADIIEKERCDVMYVPGYIAKDLINNPQLKAKFAAVQSGIVAGERFPSENLALKDDFFKVLNVFYGSTEAGGVSCFSSDNIDDYEDGIIGTPLDGVELKVIDENGSVVEFGDQGELCVRSAWKFVGYFGSSDLYEKNVDVKGWFHSGDLAHFRQDGNIVVDGRKIENVIMQSVKYFPWDVEKTLRNCPGAQTVIAVGVPEQRLSNVFCACVVPKHGVTLTADDVKRYSDEVFLEEGTAGGITIKPRYYLIFDKVLLTSSGKINRLGMAKAAKERLGL